MQQLFENDSAVLPHYCCIKEDTYTITNFEPEYRYVDKWSEAESELQQGNNTGEKYHKLQQTMRELTASGDVGELYTALQMMQRIEEKHKTSPPSVNSNTSSTSSSASCSTAVTRNPRLEQVFKKVDHDNDGVISWQEFKVALKTLGDDLDDEELELVSRSLNLMGQVTMDQFIAIVETEERAMMAEDGHFLRHVLHHHAAEHDLDNFIDHLQ